MREILFRGKRVDGGKWVEGLLFTVELDTYSEEEKKKYTHCIVEPKVEMYRGEISSFDFVKPETVGQYTELTDRNGKKIFEGDIIKYEYHASKDKIEFANGAFGYRCIRFDYFASFDDSEYGILTELAEVIGNIHDNPELLEEARK